VEPVDLAAVADDFDREVALTPAIDRFCSSTAWILAASAALMPARASFSFRGEHGYFAAMRGVHPAGFPYVEPVELAWGLAAPLIGRDPQQLAILSGLTVAGPQRRALDATLPPRWERRRGQPTVRHVASLEGGMDGFLSRRAREFRKSLRKAQRGAVTAGITFDVMRATNAVEANSLYDRIQAVELRSWKSRDHVGIASGPMRAFYAAMLPRIAELGQQRTIFARMADRDVGYILGAVMAGEYRGLQFSYDEELGEHSIGSLLQLEQIAELCRDGVGRYDLGTEMDYKRRWAEELMETEMLVLVR
jgi:hypothetical protein